MAQQEKALAGIPEDMSLIPQTPGKRRRRAVYSGLHSCTIIEQVCTHTHILTCT